MDWPPDDELARLLAGVPADPVAASTFAGAVLDPLEADLRRQFPRVNPALLGDAVDTAVAWAVKHPDRYDPARLPLPGFLRLVARRRLLNLFKAEGRHHRNRIPWDAVELAAPAGNNPTEDILELPAGVLAELSDAERRVLDLMLDGERDADVFAAALGCADKPASDRRAEAKRVKDRIKARLRRAGGRRD